MEYATFKKWWPNEGAASIRNPKSAEKVTER